MKTLLLVGFCISPIPAQDTFALRWATVDGGGGPSPASTEFALGGSSVGQWEARPPDVNGGPFSLAGGFWTFSPDLPELRLSLDGGVVTLTWDDFGVPAVLEMSVDLVLWEAVQPQPVDALFEEAGSGRKFYRLVRP